MRYPEDYIMRSLDLEDETLFKYKKLSAQLQRAKEQLRVTKDETITLCADGFEGVVINMAELSKLIDDVNKERKEYKNKRFKEVLADFYKNNPKR